MPVGQNLFFMGMKLRKHCEIMTMFGKVITAGHPSEE